jgi:hypothetical protein
VLDGCLMGAEGRAGGAKWTVGAGGGTRASGQFVVVGGDIGSAGLVSGRTSWRLSKMSVREHNVESVLLVKLMSREQADRFWRAWTMSLAGACNDGIG